MSRWPGTCGTRPPPLSKENASRAPERSERKRRTAIHMPMEKTEVVSLPLEYWANQWLSPGTTLTPAPEEVELGRPSAAWYRSDKHINSSYREAPLLKQKHGNSSMQKPIQCYSSKTKHIGDPKKNLANVRRGKKSGNPELPPLSLPIAKEFWVQPIILRMRNLHFSAEKPWPVSGITESVGNQWDEAAVGSCPRLEGRAHLPGERV